MWQVIPGFDLDEFVAAHVTARRASMFRRDVDAHASMLRDRIEGASVLVVGGAGSIGSAFIKVLLGYAPSRLYVVDVAENGLTELTRDLRSGSDIRVPGEYRTYPIDFGDPLFARLLAREAPFDIVANFAAHKHVRSERDHYSVAAMLQNNVVRNHALLERLVASPPSHVFCVSTDKAANPVNVMGASKKLMEELLLAYADEVPVATARFANVAFSQGSLLDGFLHRLRKGQPLSAPRDVRRYFVSPRESGELCLLACMLGKPGEIFFPKLAESQMKTFSEIAERLLECLGLQPVRCASEEEARRAAAERAGGREWPVYFFDSDTTGEKPYEEFFADNERPNLGRFEAVGVLRGAPTFSRSGIGQIVSSLQQLLADPGTNKGDVVQFLARAIPAFQHLETGRHLDQRM